MAKILYRIQHIKKKRSRKQQRQRWNRLVYGKTIENVSKSIDLRLVGNEKDYLKKTSKPRNMSHETFDNGLVAIRESKFK